MGWLSDIQYCSISWWLFEVVNEWSLWSDQSFTVVLEESLWCWNRKLGAECRCAAGFCLSIMETCQGDTVLIPVCNTHILLRLLPALWLADFQARWGFNHYQSCLQTCAHALDRYPNVAIFYGDRHFTLARSTLQWHHWASWLPWI